MIRDLILEVREAKSNRSKCNCCKRKIEKGELRGMAWDDYWNTPYFYCRECTIKILQNNIRVEKEMLEKLGVKEEASIDEIQEMATANGLVVR